MTPSCPSASAASRNACAAARSLVTSRGTFSAGGTTPREPFEPLDERPVDEVLAFDVQAIEAEQRQGQRALQVRDSSLRPKRRIVSWNGRGAALARQREHLAVENRGAAPAARRSRSRSPARSRSRRAPFASNTRTPWSPLWICTRAPSSLYSSTADSSAASALVHVAASGSRASAPAARRASNENARAPRCPPRAPLVATGATPPASMIARRTSAGATSAAAAIASAMTPSRAPCRSSPSNRPARTAARAPSPRRAMRLERFLAAQCRSFARDRAQRVERARRRTDRQASARRAGGALRRMYTAAGPRLTLPPGSTPASQATAGLALVGRERPQAIGQQARLLAAAARRGERRRDGRKLVEHHGGGLALMTVMVRDRRRSPQAPRRATSRTAPPDPTSRRVRVRPVRTSTAPSASLGNMNRAFRASRGYAPPAAGSAARPSTRAAARGDARRQRARRRAGRSRRTPHSRRRRTAPPRARAARATRASRRA